ncbi:hypothetical protein IFM89_029839 [Coptis chinensis]|uniref:F-box domain-containing protein n=1 Tax=Coptis chinensis TaxID=261450 RepID=A0A835HKM0_9MAGN|nr:hypothetical protein IFM89_029839 [Coptis chinensis]
MSGHHPYHLLGHNLFHLLRENSNKRLPTLPDEVIVEIFSRVPPKSVVRFRCLSKSWCKTLSDPNFIKTHLSHAIAEDKLNIFILSEIENIRMPREVRPKSGSGFCSITRMWNIEGELFNKSVEVRNPFVSNQYATAGDLVLFVASCNGLVCLLSEDRVCLLNPSTRECKIVNFGKNRCWHYGLTRGFGYDPITDNYKLVEISIDRNFHDIFNTETRVYSLSNASSSTTFSNSYRIKNPEDAGIYLNGALHWIGYVKGCENETVIVFDLTEEVFRVVPGPTNGYCYCYDVCMQKNKYHCDVYGIVCVFGGKLCLVVDRKKAIGVEKCLYGERDFEIWVMKEYGVKDSWSKLFSINVTVMDFIRNSLSWDYYQPIPTPICFTNNGEILLKAFGNLVFYDPLKETIRTLEDLQKHKHKIHGLVTYVPSLCNQKLSTVVSLSNQKLCTCTNGRRRTIASNLAITGVIVHRWL